MNNGGGGGSLVTIEAEGELAATKIEKRKRGERRGGGSSRMLILKQSVLFEIPFSLPSLSKPHQIQKRGARSLAWNFETQPCIRESLFSIIPPSVCFSVSFVCLLVSVDKLCKSVYLCVCQTVCLTVLYESWSLCLSFAVKSLFDILFFALSL